MGILSELRLDENRETGMDRDRDRDRDRGRDRDTSQSSRLPLVRLSNGGRMGVLYVVHEVLMTVKEAVTSAKQSWIQLLIQVI